MAGPPKCTGAILFASHAFARRSPSGISQLKETLTWISETSSGIKQSNGGSPIKTCLSSSVGTGVKDVARGNTLRIVIAPDTHHRTAVLVRLKLAVITADKTAAVFRATQQQLGAADGTHIMPHRQPYRRLLPRPPPVLISAWRPFQPRRWSRTMLYLSSFVYLSACQSSSILTSIIAVSRALRCSMRFKYDGAL